MQTGPTHLLLLQPASQPATAVATSHLPSSHCTWLQPHSHSSPTLGPWPMQSYLSSCPGVCQARHRQRGPNICLLNIYSVVSSAPTTAPVTGNNPEPNGQSTCSHVQPPRNIFLQFFSPSGTFLIWRCWKMLFFLCCFSILQGSACPCLKSSPTKVLLFCSLS